MPRKARNPTSRKPTPPAEFTNDAGAKLVLLYERWEDEKEYEDIRDYLKPFTKLAQKHAITLCRMTPTPFGFVFNFENHTYHIHVAGITETSIGVDVDAVPYEEPRKT